MRRIYTPLLSVALLLPCAAMAQVSILPGSGFHQSSYGPQFGTLENTSDPDLGGVLYLFVRNEGGIPDAIDSLTVYDAQGSIHHPAGWYCWPPQMDEAGNQLSSITLKGVAAPLAEGEAASVVVHTANGHRDSIFIPQLHTPKLRLANAVPSQDGQTLFLYVRNDGDADFLCQELRINERSYQLGADVQVTSLSSSFTVPAGKVGILRITDGLDLSEAAPLALRLLFSGGGAQAYASAFTRVVSPDLPIGSWHSSGLNPENEEGRKRLRRIGVEMLQGIGNPNFMADGHQRYHISTIREPHFGNPFDQSVGIQNVIELADEPFIKVWTVDDEPDLNGKPLHEQLLKAEAYRLHDPNTATHINLAVQKKFQRYGFYTDIVSMDHYAAPSAPNVIPMTWVPIIGRMAKVEEALEYSDVLKWNTEPRRNWSWVQLAGSVWDHQPRAAAINYQFWAHLAGGAKGLKYFVAQSGTSESFPEQWDEGVRCFKEMKQIRNLLLYGEPVLTGTTTSHTQALARTLVGPEGMVVMVMNNSISFSGNTLSGFNTNLQELTYSVEFDVPSWIQDAEAYMLTDSARISVEMQNIGNGRFRITPPHALAARSHVFAIVGQDNQAPDPITGLNVAEYTDSANYTISWKEPWDNVGVKGYHVYFNNVLVDRTHAPIYELKEQAMACAGYWKFAAYDNSGNVGEADSVLLELSGGTGPVIAQHPQIAYDTFFASNDDSYIFQFMSIDVQGITGYQWQICDDYLDPLGFGGPCNSWIDLSVDDYPLGVNYSTLQFHCSMFECGILVPEWYAYVHHDIRFRCKLIDPCGGETFSNPVVFTVHGPASVTEASISSLSLSPNPSSDGRFIVQVPEGVHGGELRVHSVTGQEVLRMAFGSDRSQLPIHLPAAAGIYSVRLVAEKGAWQGKVALGGG